MQSVEANDTKNLTLGAEGNADPGTVDPPLRTDETTERPGTPPTNFTKFGFKFKGKSDTFGVGHQIHDPHQQRVSVPTKPRRQGTTSSGKQGDSKNPQPTNDAKSSGDQGGSS